MPTTRLPVTPLPAHAPQARAVARFAVALLALAASALAAAADGAAAAAAPSLGPVPIDFILFACTLAGVALFHHHTLKVALTGLSVITLYKLVFTGFKEGAGILGLLLHLKHEWVILANLFLLLMGFALLSRHFEKSRVPLVLPRFLPPDWRGAFLLLVMVFVLSSFLDNIAAALIGGAMAHQLFRAKVHIGYLAAIVAASNAGGAGSVIGDTTTTMMWLAGISPVEVVEAYVAASVALVLFGIPAAKQQHAHQPMIHHVHQHTPVDWTRVGIVVLILLCAIIANVTVNLQFNEYSDYFPFIGFGVWVAIVISLPARRPDWEVLPETFKGTLFLLALVTSASMMPVDRLPPASWQSAFGLGFVSAVFDNIPLTALALKQGGYDWGFLAYAVGFGGSMIWFGSSAGVALSNQFPEAKSAIAWIRGGWHVAIAYLIGFFVMLFVIGWHPQSAPKTVSDCAPVAHPVSALRADTDSSTIPCRTPRRA
jgi:Na+/H+ antiporter NhaD/arsenite permease-like protein